MDNDQHSMVLNNFRRSRRTVLKAAVVNAAAVAGAAFVPNFAKAATEIPIGVVVGLTGAGADYGRDALRAFQLVADRVNRSGGINSLGGATIKLHVADHQTDLRVASSETERLITRENVLGILGWAASGPARVGSEVSERYQVPSIDTSVDYKLTERGLKYFYRAAINTRQTCDRGVAFVQDMEKTHGAVVKRVAILHEDLAYGTGAGDLFEAAIKSAGRWQLVDRVAYTAARLTEATGIVNKLKAQNVDAVFQASYPADGILIQRAMKQLRLNLVANVHPAGAPPNIQYVGNLKDDANYVICTLGWTPTMEEKLPPIAKATVGEYTKLYNVAVQDQTGYSLSAAAAMVAALSQIRSLDRAALWQAIDKVDVTFGQDPNVIIPFGVKWDEKHDNAKSQPAVTQILNQQLVVVAPKELASAAPVVPPPTWDKRA
jgi:branched-chain amino acid transport system substrate-binding protein